MKLDTFDFKYLPTFSDTTMPLLLSSSCWIEKNSEKSVCLKEVHED